MKQFSNQACPIGLGEKLNSSQPEAEWKSELLVIKASEVFNL